jgi:hypothetical protein
VKVPTNRKGEIIQPVDTDSIVLGITNFKILGVIDSITFSLIMGMIDSRKS